MRDTLVVLVLVVLSTPFIAGASGKWTPVEFRNLVGGPELTVSEMSSRYGDGFTTKRLDAGNLPNADANDLVVQYSYNDTAVFSFFVDGDNGKEFLMAWQILRGFDVGGVHCSSALTTERLIGLLGRSIRDARAGLVMRNS